MKRLLCLKLQKGQMCLNERTFFVGELKDSGLKLRTIMECDRVLCAAPEYLSHHGTPTSPDDLLDQGHNCLLLRYPRSPEYFWVLETNNGPRKLEVAGKYDSDDGDVLMEWALAGHGIVNKPRFEVQHFLNSGQLVTVLPDNPPTAAKLAVIFPHKDFQDPKLRLFIDFMAARCQKMIRAALQ